ncbi:hypothetical protein DXG03_002477, partial [Asterophora parasitica]
MTEVTDLPPLPPSPIPSESANLVDEVLIPRAQRDAKFYFNFVTFQVEDRLFMLPRHQFTQSATFFVDLLNPAVDEQIPITLEDVTKADFQALLNLMYPLDPTCSKPALSTAEWESVLKLTSRWFMLDLRKVAIDALSDLPPLHKIILAREYGVLHWLRDGYTHLASRAESLSVGDANTIGLNATLKIVAIREEPLQRRRDYYGGSLDISTSGPYVSAVHAEFAAELGVMGESQISAVERVKLARQYKVADWLSAALCELTQRREAISVEEVTELGLETSIALWKARERSLLSYGGSITPNSYMENFFAGELRRVRAVDERYNPPPLPATPDPYIASVSSQGEKKKKKKK